MSIHNCYCSAAESLCLYSLYLLLNNSVLCCYSWTEKTVYLWNKALSCPEVYLVWNWSRPEMTKTLFSLGFSILQPWWTWGRSSTSTGSCKKLKPITSEHFNWNQTTPSRSPTCVSCGTSWRNRAWGPRAPELTLPAYLPSVRQTWGKGRPTRSSFALLIQGRWKRLRKDVCSERPWLCRTALLMTPELCIHLRPAAFLRSIAHSLAGATWYLDPSELSSKLVLSQEPRFFFSVSFFKTRALELEVRP